MSLLHPGKCRSTGCNEPADYYVELLRSDKRGDHWTGEFCHDHLIRAIDLKTLELDVRHYMIVIEPLLRAGNDNQRRWLERRSRKEKARLKRQLLPVTP